MHEGKVVPLPLVKKAVADNLMAKGDDEAFVQVNGNLWIVQKKKVATLPGQQTTAAGAGRG